MAATAKPAFGILDSQDYPVFIWNAATGEEVRRLQGLRCTTQLAFSPDGKVLVCGSSCDGIQRWDAATGKALHGRVAARFEAVSYSASGKLLALETWGGNVRLQTLAPDALLWRSQVRDVLYAAVISPDQKTLSLTILPGTTELWEVASGKLRRSFDTTTHLWAPRPTALSPDGRLLACSVCNETIELWDLPSGQSLGFFEGHHGRINTLLFSPDGRLLISGSTDTTILVWEVSKLIRARRLRQVPLSPQELESCWKALAGTDAGLAFAAQWKLMAAPDQAVVLLRDHLRQAAPGPRQLARWITQLDSEDFAVRERATAALAGVSPHAEASLRQALAANPSAEARRRMQLLLKQIERSPVSGWVPAVRAVEVLEHLGTPQARGVLKQLADDASTAPLSCEARAALERLERRRPTPP